MPIIRAPVTFPTATSGAAALGSDYTVTTSHADTGLSVTLPAAGTYLVLAAVTARAQTTAGIGAIDVRLYNTTDAAAVSGSDRRCGVVSSGLDAMCWATAGLSWLVTVAASKTIRLEATKTTISAPTWSVATVAADYTTLSYVKLAA